MKYLENEEELYVDNTENLSARSFMTPIIRNNNSLDETEQRKLVGLFNEFLNNHRKNIIHYF